MPSMSPVNWIRRPRLGQQANAPNSADMPSPEERRNARLLRYEAPFTSLALGGVPNFIALFAIELGASNALVGWLTSGPALLNLGWLIPCGRLVQRARSYGYALAAGALFQRLLLIALAGVVFLPASWRPAAVVLLVTLSTLPNTMWGISFHTASGELFSPQHLTRLVGQRWAAANITSVIGMLALGKLIDALPFPLNFQVMFVGIGVVTLTSVALVLRLRFPPRTRSSFEKMAIWQMVRVPSELWRRYRPFISYEAGILIAQLALYAAVPLLRIYWVRDLHATGGWVGALTAVFSVGATLGNLLWGRWSHPSRDRRNVLIASCGVLAAYPMLTAAFGSLAPLLGVMFLAGFFSGGNDLLLFNRTVQLTPRDQRPTFIAFHNITINSAAFAGPLLSTILAELWGARMVLVVIGALGLLGALLIYLLGWGELRQDEEADSVGEP